MSFSDLLGNRKFQLIFLSYSSLLIFLGRANEIGLLNYDEAYYAQKAKEVLTGSNIFIMTLNNTPLFDNPPFFMWMAALSFKLFGVSAWSAILPSALFGTATVCLTYMMSERLFENRWAAFLSGIILLFPGFFVDYARRGMVDVTLTFLILLSIFGFIRGIKEPKWFLIFGVGSACAILTKSVAGFFPLITGCLFLIFTRRFKFFGNGYFLSGIMLALGLGSSWYLVNWLKFGSEFIDAHFGWLLFNRTLQGTQVVREVSEAGPFYFLGYIFELFKNYWPWIPFTMAGIYIFGKKALQEKNENCLIILLWIGVNLLIVSVGRIQYLRYILPIYPALAIVTSSTISNWLTSERKDKLIPVMVGSVMVSSLLINSSAIEIRNAASLSKNSVFERELISIIKGNTNRDEEIGNYKLRRRHPRNVVYFYGDRYIADPVNEANILFEIMETNPEKTWLARLKEFNKLYEISPEKLYLIQANKKYAYFTSSANKVNINYNLSGKFKDELQSKNIR